MSIKNISLNNFISKRISLKRIKHYISSCIVFGYNESESEPRPLGKLLRAAGRRVLDYGNAALSISNPATVKSSQGNEILIYGR